MKRIDDKIKEIEKKDKNSRVLYIIIVLLIAGFMAYALSSEKKIEGQKVTISAQEEKLAKQVEDLEKLNIQLNDTINLLKQSQTPVAFWNETTKTGIAKSYLDYITHKGKPETQPEYIEMAVEALNKNATPGKKGWIYCGKMEDGKFKFKDNYAKIVWRANEAGDLSDKKPEKGDVMENILQNRYTYSNRECTNQNGASLAWNKGAKVFVTNTRQDGNAVYVKLKF